jgi:hypothetical protein
MSEEATMTTRSQQDCSKYLRNYSPIWEGAAHRVGYFVQGVNVRHGPKKLDFVGHLWGGMGFAIEVKERQAGTRFPFSLFDKEDNDGMDQAGHLNCIYEAGAYSAIWLQEVNGPRRGEDRAVLLLWEEWIALKENPPMRTFKSDRDPEPYASVSIDDILERYPWTEMVYAKVKGQGGRWYSRYEYENGCQPRHLFDGRADAPDYEEMPCRN